MKNQSPKLRRQGNAQFFSPHSTFHKYVKAGIYPANWCGDNSVKIEAGE
jgi:hypothetical protein